MLDYEKLDVYRCAIEHLAFVFKSVQTVPRGYSALTDQWRRAAMSVPLNIAEAVGKPVMPIDTTATPSPGARRCGAIIDVVRLVGGVSELELAAAKQLLVRV